jgi:ABC-type sugar transport system ATPase subunit
MASMTLSNISKYYGDVCAIKNLSFHCEDGEMLALLGPSGCGKTSTLKMISGIEDIDEGDIRFDDRVVNDLSPGKRNIAMVFEDYALYPNMSVWENIVFPLKLRRWSKQEMRKRAEPVLELLDLGDQKDSNVRNLSGGAQQRVSIGRALVREPDLIIFDEPLSHLDAAQKVQLRMEIRRLQKVTGLTGILVTHDQTEAFAMADRVVVMNQGELQQIDNPQTLYEHPSNLFVANFIGEPPMNLLPVRLEGNDTNLSLSSPGWNVTPGKMLSARINTEARGGDIILGIRPELIQISTLENEMNLSVRGKVSWREYRGDAQVLTIALFGGDSEVTVETRQLKGLEIGTIVGLEFPDMAINIFDAVDGRNLLPVMSQVHKEEMS